MKYVKMSFYFGLLSLLEILTGFEILERIFRDDY